MIRSRNANGAIESGTTCASGSPSLAVPASAPRASARPKLERRIRLFYAVAVASIVFAAVIVIYDAVVWYRTPTVTQLIEPPRMDVACL